MQQRLACMYLTQLLVLRVMSSWMAGHTLLGHWVLVCLLLLLEVVLVVESSFRCHVWSWHGVVVGWHPAWLSRLDLGVVVLG